MDMQYCDSCGEVIQGQALEESTVGSKFICAECRATGRHKPSSLSGKSDLSLSSAMQNSNLELYSSDTIAKRREDTRGGNSRLTLVDDQPEEASPLEETRIDVSRPSVSATNVDLVTTLHQQAQEHTGSTFYVRKDSSQSGQHTQSSGTGSASGSTATRMATTIRVHCAHCDAKLGIKPVAQKSKMKCPRCEGILIINVDGTASKPQAGSTVTTKETRPPAEVVSELAGLLRGTDTLETPTSTPAPETQLSLAAESQNEISAATTDVETPAARSTNSTFESALETASNATATAVATDVMYDDFGVPVTESSSPVANEIETPESAFLAKTESQEIQLQALLGAEEKPPQVTLFPHQLPVRPEHMVMAFFVASLPAFIGLGLIQVLDYPEYADVLKGYGRVVQEHLVQVRGWLGL